MQAQMSGTRLAYVVVPIDEKVKRYHYNMKREVHGKLANGQPHVSHTMEKVLTEEDGGFMIYFPRGHAIRLRTKEELKHYKVDKLPMLIDLKGLHDPNSAIGKLMAAQDDAARRGAMQSLEKQVIAIVTGKAGAQQLTIDESAAEQEAA